MIEKEDKSASGGEYDSPIMLGDIDIEPQRYVAEKPYDLTRYPYSYLKRNYSGGFWFNIAVGATAGFVLTVLGKAIFALLDKENPSLDMWEIITIAIGVAMSLYFKCSFKSEDDKIKSELNEVVDTHFQKSKPRRVHLPGQEGEE